YASLPPTLPPPPRSTLFPTRRSSDLPGALQPAADQCRDGCRGQADGGEGGHDEAGLSGDQAARAGGQRRGGVRDGDFLPEGERTDRKSTRLNSSHVAISYAVFCLKKK